jgi:hypothetical protein
VVLDSIRVYWIDGTKGKRYPRPVVRINRLTDESVFE